MRAGCPLVIKFTVVRFYQLGWLICVLLAFSAKGQKLLDLQLAGQFDAELPINQYLVSEKFDGVRGHWTGRKMLSRTGREINLPAWFTRDFPNIPLDGELWIARGEFESISALVRTQAPDPQRWQTVKFMVFDLPSSKHEFGQRYQQMLAELQDLSPYLAVVPQFEVFDRDSLNQLLEKYVADGAEGLMLHRKNAHYRAGRSQNIVKLKLVYDAEAKVIAHVSGKGKYQGMLGALRVRTPQGVEFSLGTGFSNAERQNPPAVGTEITYKYRGLTKYGVPRFASFYRVKTHH